MPLTSHEQYFAGLANDVRNKLTLIQATVESLLPGAERCVSYNMPAYKGRKVFFYFAAFKKHIGVFPPVKADRELIMELKDFRGPKGNLVFPLNRPLPFHLIGRVAKALYEERGQ